jgi:uncharacterized protein (TIGR02118 family)
MYKLVILIGPLDNWAAFDEAWPLFLHEVENMPGLRREATSRVDTVLYGTAPVAFVHELFFDSLDDAQGAMASPQGRAAGRLLQAMTGGQLTLYLADHKEDDLENILKYRGEAC